VITCVGDLVTDIVVHTHGPFQPGSDTRSTITRHRGGSAANVAALVAAEGGRARFVGCVGADPDADRLISRLVAHGVEVVVTRASHTGTLIVVVTPDGERHFFTDRGACTELGPTQPDWLDGATWLHLPLYSFSGQPIAATARDLADEATRRGIPTSIDTSSTAVIADLGADAVLELLGAITPDVVFANASEAALLGLGPGSPAPGATTTVVRHGGDVTHVVDRSGTTRSVPVPPVDVVVDTTGAGDAFAAGWLLSTERGASASDAIHLAHRLAASLLATAGADREGR
jgi:sugar/nucleoside kinase (ribokinase family)